MTGFELGSERPRRWPICGGGLLTSLLRPDGAAACRFSESEKLVQGVADASLTVLALLAVAESFSVAAETTVQQSAQTQFGCGLQVRQVAIFCLETSC